MKATCLSQPTALEHTMAPYLPKTTNATHCLINLKGCLKQDIVCRTMLTTMQISVAGDSNDLLKVFCVLKETSRHTGSHGYELKKVKNSDNTTICRQKTRVQRVCSN